jgi:hypothetical protein
VTDEKPTKDEDERPLRTTKPIFIRTDIQPSDVIRGEIPDSNIEKRSKFCKHGNVWGRCPEGC